VQEALTNEQWRCEVPSKRNERGARTGETVEPSHEARPSPTARIATGSEIWKATGAKGRKVLSERALCDPSRVSGRGLVQDANEGGASRAREKEGTSQPG